MVEFRAGRCRGVAEIAIKTLPFFFDGASLSELIPTAQNRITKREDVKRFPEAAKDSLVAKNKQARGMPNQFCLHCRQLADWKSLIFKGYPLPSQSRHESSITDTAPV